MATRPTRRGVGCLLVVLVLLVVSAAVAGFSLLRSEGLADPVPGQQRCVVSAGEQSVVLDLEQARLTSIIVGLSVRRGLAPRAASVAMATAYQESGIRNLSGGDRDSVGLFQQRPSQGWGSAEQLQDPYYTTGKFYDALVKVDGWQTDDINDVAQKVQRSGYPEAYRDHEADARVLASALTGNSTAALSCLERSGKKGDPEALLTALQRSLGPVDERADGTTVTFDAASTRLAWAYAQHAVANAARYGVTDVTVDDRTWQTNGTTMPTWSPVPEPVGSRTVVLRFRAG